MKKLRRSSGLVVLLTVLLAGGAAADVHLSGAGALEQYCADEDTAPHPKLVVMPQVVTTDDLATFGGTMFAGIYQTVGQPEQPGRMTVRVWIRRADGSREKIGRIVAWQQENGAAEMEEMFPVAVRKGDSVIWRYRFKDFEPLNAGDCFMLIGATVRP